MYKNKKVVVLIPARGGSKGIPYKNIKLLIDKPLIGWTIELAKSIPEIDKVTVSTDDVNISIISKYYGAEIINRPSEISRDNSLSLDAVKHALKTLEESNEKFDIMLYLEPTAPLRTKEDIFKCLDLLIDHFPAYTSAATFSEAPLHPYRAWRLDGAEPKTFISDAQPFLPRQKLPSAYKLNGCVYSFYTEGIYEKTGSFLDGRMGGIITDHERAVDIDHLADFLLAEEYLKRRIGNEG